MAWFALCFTGGLLGSLSQLVQFLTGLRFATLAGIALPGCGLCMAWGVAYVGFPYRPRVLLPVWRLPFRLWPILVLFLLAGVALWHKLDMLEDALAMPTDCALLVDIDGVVQSHGEDLVHDAIDAAADTLIREEILACQATELRSKRAGHERARAQQLVSRLGVRASHCTEAPRAPHIAQRGTSTQGSAEGAGRTHSIGPKLSHAVAT
ncbi:hypothetical protein V6N11_058322 [Hibiscus sabdariffa]|uniref:Uncharacterized protein n=1 Tax=Hibiscus sabdariffa TaxID=183260 RepID=A0ABR2U4P7_9ROSI